MKPNALRIERLLAKVEADLARSARPRRYVFHYDEVAEAEAQGLPYVLVPRELSPEEWIEQYSGERRSDAAVSGADPIDMGPGFAAMLERIEGNGVRTLGCRCFLVCDFEQAGDDPATTKCAFL
jgi:hypothetical protein